MTRPVPDIAGASAASDPARDWEATRALGEIQYAPVPPAAPPEPPEWLRRLSQWLEEMFGHSAGGQAFDWPMVWKGLAVLAAVLAVILLWRIAAPALARWRARTAARPAEPWRPDRAEAEALLEDADRLAGEGRFDEAAHLLLRRSLTQIASARPDLLHPSSTAREIARLPGLPAAVRQPVAVIAERVERSRYALRPLDVGDWQAARHAYADFALARIAG